MASGKVRIKPSRMGEWEAFIVINNESKALISPLLQQKKLDPNLGFRGTTLLATAIHRNSPDIVKMLLEHGANPNKKSNENDRYEPPIITATRLKYLHIVTILMEHGADLTLTNFYGEDAIYQAVVANAFGILSYFLSTKPHGNCFHESEKLCPMQRAILDGESYASKRKCFLILVKYHYTCSCQRSSTNPMATFTHLLNYKNRTSRIDLIKLLYLSYGINLLNEAPSTSESNSQNNLMSSQLVTKCSINQINQINQLVTLSNLVRISIRSTISEIAKKRKKPFCTQINQLPLPPKIIKFLLMDELPV